MNTFYIKPGLLSLKDLRYIINNKCKLKITNEVYDKVSKARVIVDNIVRKDETVYGINTGFGKLASKKINASELGELQTRLVLSHATGTGTFLDNTTIQILFILKINSLAQGYSGISIELLDYLLFFYNNEIYPLIPEQGSVGASGDLAPLAHMSLPLIGHGNVNYKNNILSVSDVLYEKKMKPYILKAKEGLALLNGTQVSTAIAIKGLIEVMRNFSLATMIGSLSIDASKSSIVPFSHEIACLKKSKGQVIFSAKVRDLLQGSTIMEQHTSCDKVQDPYCMRCQPQVMGAILDQIFHAQTTLENEMNSVSDNPLVLIKENKIVSGGNFHAEGVAITADILSIICSEIGSISERRIAMMTDSHISGLPNFLVQNSGLNSGFMIAHVTAAALASENKVYSHPASVDSIPTSANQEDHVSMATFAAKKLNKVTTNVIKILAIEFLAACQGLEFHKPHITGIKLRDYFLLLRKQVPFYEEDRFLGKDINTVEQIIKNKKFYSELIQNIFDI